ncbi:MAG: arginine--tRNA ligase, partial [Alphaproteobacteria bacterium]|nr:arginine--tRNA ligase [Alphaproteobacteria bacterium]
MIYLSNIQKIVQNGFEKAGFHNEVIQLTESNRPELSDVQCNDALRLAKQLGKNPRDIGESVKSILENESVFEKVSVDGPGFLNFTLSDKFWIQKFSHVTENERFGLYQTSAPQTVVVDYGGPNLAKPLHAGHLRSAVIGESVKRILKFAGEKTIGDVHFGDWGLQMGLVSAEIERRDIAPIYFDKNYEGKYPSESPVSMSDLAEIYPSASGCAKEDDNFKKVAQDQTVRLQNGERGLRALWQHCHDISLEAIKESYRLLEVDFDLWMGEADVHDRVRDLIQEFKADGKLEESEGALVVSVKEESDKKEMPPVLVLKSNGSVGYHATDIATIDYRFKELHAEKMIYVVDQRQSLHFEQLFRVVKKLGIVPQKFPFIHVGYGTMNAKDGKPFKTRAGGVLRLEDMIQILKDAAGERLREPNENLARQVGVAALKFGDLMNPPRSDYVLDLDSFTQFEGKTGPYIQYTAVRIQSILS